MIPQWTEFGPLAFDQAKTEGKLVLLLLTVPWCSYCRELREATFTDPKVVEEIRRLFVPVRVDAARRPDVNERYGTGGWPTIAYLTPTGDLHDDPSSLST